MRWLLATLVLVLALLGCTSRETSDTAIAEGGCSIECSVCFGLDLRCFDAWNLTGTSDATDVELPIKATGP